MSDAPKRYTAEKLRPVLEAQGRRQDWLAYQVGISPSLLNRAMSGTKTISEDVAQRIAVTLGVPFFLIFDFPKGNDSSLKGAELEVAS